ncbi:MAG: phosphatidylserine decarboxylase family protein [Nitrospirae bacterium]|nr:MAG: phosphatidylserine decarboxylase family protein [Nitrospirota bacterium]
MADRAVGIPIVREGFPFVAATGGPAVMAGALGWTVPALVLGAIALFTAWFFRNPRRLVPDGARVVVAPGDGRVMAIEQEYEPRFLKEQGIRLSIFLSVLDVHVNRIPCDGKVEDIVYQPGQFLAANRPDATLRNEQNALMIRTTFGAKVLCVQVAGLLARRIVCWASPGETVARGERFGLIRFGSRVDTFLPLGTVLGVAVGDCVKGGETILGELPCVEI